MGWEVWSKRRREYPRALEEEILRFARVQDRLRRRAARQDAQDPDRVRTPAQAFVERVAREMAEEHDRLAAAGLPDWPDGEGAA